MPAPVEGDVKWIEAVNMSQIGVAERPTEHNAKEPARVSVWISKKGRKQIQVRSGACRKRSWGRWPRRLSVKAASRFDDWEPVRPYTGTVCLALSMEDHSKPRFHIDHRIKRREYRRRRRERKAQFDEIAKTLSEK